MGENSSIAWTHHTFNPWLGCTKVSPGCKHCYAEKYAQRFGRATWGPGQLRQKTKTWREPRAWARAAAESGVRPRVFCASLADVFDVEVPPEWRSELFALIAETPSLDWLLLTKRAEQLALMRPEGGWATQVWLGVTVESQEQAQRRIPLLLAEQPSVRFLSMEPLLETVDLRPWLSRGVDWVIVGGESGDEARPFHLDWARDVVAQCREAGVPVFMKQLGAHCIRPPEDRAFALSEKAGAEPEEWPLDLRVREFPRVEGGKERGDDDDAREV